MKKHTEQTYSPKSNEKMKEMHRPAFGGREFQQNLEAKLIIDSSELESRMSQIPIHYATQQGMLQGNLWNAVQKLKKNKELLFFRIHSNSLQNHSNKNLEHSAQLHPQLLFPHPQKKEFPKLGIPCLLWDETTEDRVYITERTIVEARNYCISDLQSMERSDLISISTATRILKSELSESLFYVRENELLSALTLIQNLQRFAPSLSLFLHEQSNESTLQGFLHTRRPSTILVSYTLLHARKRIRATAYNYVLHGVHTITCGVGACRACIIVQEKHNYPICLRGILQRYA